MNSFYDPWFIIGILLIGASVPTFFRHKSYGIMFLLVGSLALRFW
jgi:uncharacterized membrane protein